MLGVGLEPLEGQETPFTDGGPPKPSNPAPSSGNEAVGSPRIGEGDPTRPAVPPDSGPSRGTLRALAARDTPPAPLPAQRAASPAIRLESAVVRFAVVLESVYHTRPAPPGRSLSVFLYYY